MARNNLDTAYTDDLYITRDTEDPRYSIFASLSLISIPIFMYLLTSSEETEKPRSPVGPCCGLTSADS